MSKKKKYHITILLVAQCLLFVSFLYVVKTFLHFDVNEKQKMEGLIHERMRQYGK